MSHLKYQNMKLSVCGWSKTDCAVSNTLSEQSCNLWGLERRRFGAGPGSVLDGPSQPQHFPVLLQLSSPGRALLSAMAQPAHLCPQQKKSNKY